MDRSKIQDLKTHFKNTHLKTFEDLGVYYWIAGGSIRDFFLGREPKDVDFYFSNSIDRRRAAYFLTENNFELVHSHDNHDVLIRDNVRYETFYNQGDATPKECIENFDFTICSCALDNKLEFSCHDDFFKDLENLHLARIPQAGKPVSTTCKRLKKFLNTGYDIDRQNLIKWLNDVEKTS